MTDDYSIPDDNDNSVLIFKGKTLTTEREIGKAASEILRKFDNVQRHSLKQLHELILTFGRMLHEGRKLYAHDDLGFGEWIKRYHLDTGKLGRNQRERNACMQIADLHDIGAHIDNAVPRKLEFDGCNYTTPTDIMKWVRKTQRFLLPHLKPLKEPMKGEMKGKKKREPKDIEEFEPDEIGDLGVDDEDQWISDLKVQNQQLRERVIELEAENAALKAENAQLRERLNQTVLQ